MRSVVCIAGLDPSGYAGLSADFRALSFLGVRCLPIASTLTAQNENSFSGMWPVPSEFIEKQLDAIFDAHEPDAVKLGLLGSSEVAKLVASYLSSKTIPIITDPVFASSTGYRLVDAGMIENYKQDIIPMSRMVTPNAREASMISGLEVKNPGDAGVTCQRIYELGADSVLLKGGHFRESIGTDVFYDSSGLHIIGGEELDINIRGTGCAYSSLIAGYISLGMDTMHAVKKAKEEMIIALSTSARTGGSLLMFGHGIPHEHTTNSGDAQ